MPDALALDRIAVGEIDFASQSQSPHASSRAISDAAPRTMGTAVHVVVRCEFSAVPTLSFPLASALRFCFVCLFPVQS